MNPAEYEIMAGVEDAHWWYRGLRGMISMFLGRFFEGQDARILDIGCGTGANLSSMGRYGNSVGLDVSREALRLSQSRGLDSLAQGDALHLPYADESFDVVLLMDVLYHRAVPDKTAPMREVRRVLKPGGIVLLNVPAYQWLMSSHDVAVHTDRRFMKGEIQKLLSESGFTSLSATYWNSFLFPVVVIIRKFFSGNQNGESDLAGYRESLLTTILSWVLFVERVLLRVLPLPFGLSIFAVARK